MIASSTVSIEMCFELQNEQLYTIRRRRMLLISRLCNFGGIPHLTFVVASAILYVPLNASSTIIHANLDSSQALHCIAPLKSRCIFMFELTLSTYTKIL